MSDYLTGNGIIGGQIYIIDNNTYNNIIPSISGDATNTLTLSNAALTTSSSITSFFNNNQDNVVGGLDSSVAEVLLQDVNISLYTCASSSSINDNTYEEEDVEISNEPIITTIHSIIVDNNDSSNSSNNNSNNDDDGGLLSLYEYKFVNLLPGEYYISVQLPYSSNGNYGNSYNDIEFSPVWSGHHADDDEGRSDANAIVGSIRQREEEVEQRELGTGGIVNNNNNNNDNITTTTATTTKLPTSTINPTTGRTNCFVLQENESSMNWNVGLLLFGNGTRNNNSNNNNKSDDDDASSVVVVNNTTTTAMMMEQQQQQQGEEIIIPPKNAIYYNGFETGNFPFSYTSTSSSSTLSTIPSYNFVWSTTNNINSPGASSVVWSKVSTTTNTTNNNTTSSCNLGSKVCLKSPMLQNELHTPVRSNVTLIIIPNNNNNDRQQQQQQQGNNNGGGGTIYFHVLTSVQLPFDMFEYYLDGIKLGQLESTSTSTFTKQSIDIPPSSTATQQPHVIDFIYSYNPKNVPSNYFPDVNLFNDVRDGRVYLDDVYFVPYSYDDDNNNNVNDDNVNVTTTTTTTSPTTLSGPTTTTTTTTTTSSLSNGVSITPDGASYHQSFEVGTFPFADQQEDASIVWSTTNNLDVPNLIWEVTDEEAASGIYSLKNPILDNEDKIPSQSNLTMIMPNQGVAGGTLHFSVLAVGIQHPFDQFEYTVDGISRGSIHDPRTEFEELVLQVGPGSHIFDFVYKFNPQDIPVEEFPPVEAFPERTGLVYVDNVYFIPNGGENGIIPPGGISSTSNNPTSSPTSSLNTTSSSSSSEPASATTTTTTTAPSQIISSNNMPSSSSITGGSANVNMMQDDEGSTINNNNNVGMIVGIAFSLIVILSIIAVGLFIHRRKKKEKLTMARMNDIGDDDDDDMNVAKEVKEGGGGGRGSEVGVSVVLTKNDHDLEMGSSVMMFSHDDEQSSSSRKYVEASTTRVPAGEKMIADRNGNNDDDKPSSIVRRPNTPTSANSSDQLTLYSAGTATTKSYCPQSKTEVVIQQRSASSSLGLSPTSSYTAAVYEDKNLASLEKEYISLSTAIQSVPQGSKSWLLLNKHLVRAKDELDAVKQDIQMPSEEIELDDDDEGDRKSLSSSSTEDQPPPTTTTSTTMDSVPVHESDPVTDNNTNTMSREEESGDYIYDERSGPSTKSPEPEVWIHCEHRKEDVDSHITFDDWGLDHNNINNDVKPDPEGNTRYVTAIVPLNAITEYGEVHLENDHDAHDVSKGTTTTIDNNDGRRSSCSDQHLTEDDERKSVKKSKNGMLGLKPFTRLFKRESSTKT